MAKKPTTTNNLKEILRRNSRMAKLSDSSLDAVSKAIVSSGIVIPQEATDVIEPAMGQNSVQLSKMDIVLLALVSNPNKWFLAHSGDKPRSDIGIYSLGKCFRMIRRMENGKHNHYAMYTGGEMNSAGKKRIASINKKMENLAKAASANSPISIHDTTPIPYSVTKKTASPLPKRTRKKSSSPSKVNVNHAHKFPLNADEKQFLAFIKATPRREHLLSVSTKENIWHTFRWKWKRYGFDLSQVDFRQERVGDGTYRIYGTYTPNAVNMMNPGLKEFVDFLETKGKKSTPNLTIVETISE